MPCTNLYYLLVQFQHSNLTIFVNIADFLFLTPLQLHFGPVFDILLVLEEISYFKSKCICSLYEITIQTGIFGIKGVVNFQPLCFWLGLKNDPPKQILLKIAKFWFRVSYNAWRHPKNGTWSVYRKKGHFGHTLLNMRTGCP